MSASQFVYVSYIRTTPEKLWEALTGADFIRQYFFGVTFDTDWKPGSPWRMVHSDGKVTDAGEVLEFTPPSRLALKWRNEFMPECTAEGYTHFVAEIEAYGDATKLSVTHSADVADSNTIRAVSGGWPRILSNLKSLLETGSVVMPAK